MNTHGNIEAYRSREAYYVGCNEPKGNAVMAVWVNRREVSDH